MDSRRLSRIGSLSAIAGGAWLLGSAGVVAAESAAISLVQAAAAGADPLPRAVVGIASAGDSTLPFHLELNYRCPAGTGQQQLFASVADEARVLDVTGTAPPQFLRLDVPIRQLQWLLQPARSCATVSEQRAPDETGSDGVRYFRIHAGTVAFATILCGGPDGTSTAATGSVPLDVWLSCPAP